MLLQDGVGSPSGRASPDPARRVVRFVTRHRVLLGMIAIGAAIRFATITSQSYWLDESQAAHEVSLSFGHMWSAWRAVEGNPPLYFVLAWGWAHVFGSGEAGLRSLSALFGIALIPVVYLCGAELASRRAGLVAALLVTVSPFMVWYSQEAREYMLLTLLSAGSLLFYARAWRTGARRDLAWWAVLSALALLTQYFAGFLVLTEAVMLIGRLRSRASVLALVVQALVFAPLASHVQPQLHMQLQFITDQPLLLRVKQVPVTFVLNTLAKSSLVQWGLIGAGLSAAVVIGLLLAAGSDRELRGAVVAAVPAAGVLLLPLALALAHHDAYIARALIPAWPALAVVFAAACTPARAPLAGAPLAIALVGLFVWSGIRIDSDQVFQRPDWRAVAASLQRARVPRAIAVYPGQAGTGPLSIYLPGTPWDGPGAAADADAGPATVSELDIVANAGQTLAPLPASMRLIGRPRDVDGYFVARVSLSQPATVTAADAAAQADQLLTPAPGAPSIMFQRAGR